MASAFPFPWRVHRLDTTVSTNLDARAGVPFDVFWAEEQTAGRGRLDHKWFSAPGEGLAFSAVLDVAGVAPVAVATLPLVVGWIAVRTLASFVPGFRLKWPNDVTWQGRKVCGILCERAGDCVIAGVGVNVNQRRFPAELADRATSLFLVGAEEGRVGGVFDRAVVLSRFLNGLTEALARWRKDGFAALWPDVAAVDALKGRVVAVSRTDDDAEPVRGVCGGVKPNGTLDVGGEEIWAGEAHVLCADGVAGQ